MYSVPIGFSIIACVTDIRTRKIRNWTTYPMIISGLLFAWQCSGMEGLLSGLGNMLLTGCLVAFLPGFKSGGGDIKLAAACGTWLSLYGAESVLFFVFISMLLVWLGLVGRMLYNNGFRWVWEKILQEFRLLINGIITGNISYAKTAIATLYSHEGKHKTSGMPAAPAMLMGFCAVLVSPIIG